MDKKDKEKKPKKRSFKILVDFLWLLLCLTISLAFWEVSYQFLKASKQDPFYLAYLAMSAGNLGLSYEVVRIFATKLEKISYKKATDTMLKKTIFYAVVFLITALVTAICLKWFQWGYGH